jgi:hypothetical protein
MAKKAESRLQQNIKKALIREVGGKWWKVHGSAFQEAGQPDLDGVVDGISFKFEVKIPVEGAPSELQLQTLEEWRAVGAVACIVETPGQAVTLVKAATATPEERRKGRALYKWICRTLRATYGEDMGYGRRTGGGKKRMPRRSSRWAVDQLRDHLGEVPDGKTILVLGAP